MYVSNKTLNKHSATQLCLKQNMKQNKGNTVVVKQNKKLNTATLYEGRQEQTRQQLVIIMQNKTKNKTQTPRTK